MSQKTNSIEKHRYEALSDFRYKLRCFLRFSEDAAQEEGITALQYQLLLHPHGIPGRNWATVSEIAERLQTQVHGVVALVTRCEEAGLVERRPSEQDRRQVEIHLLPAGRRKMFRLAAQHSAQLSALVDAVTLASRVDEET